MNVLRLLPGWSWLTSIFLSKVYLSDSRSIFSVWIYTGVDVSSRAGLQWKKGERGRSVCNNFVFATTVHKIFIKIVSLTVMNVPVISCVVPQ